MTRFIGVLLFILILLASFTTAAASSPDQAADLLARINHERTTRGLAPYMLNSKLSAAAQGQATDMAARGKFSHTGSDGSTPAQRVARKGYGKYSWGLRVGENWAWYREPASAMNMWMNSAPHRENILHPLYREIGIGVAAAPMGGFVYVADFGAQPNVLPIFVNDGAGITNSPQVVLTLTNEDADSSGDGPSVVGHANQVLISNDPNFSGAQWQPFAPHIPWTLPAGGGLKTVYVKYRDSRGRTATASDAITVAASTLPSPIATQTYTPTPKKIATREPSPTSTSTPTRKPSPTSTKTPTRKPSPTRTRARPQPSPTLTAKATVAPNAMAIAWGGKDNAPSPTLEDVGGLGNPVAAVAVAVAPSATAVSTTPTVSQTASPVPIEVVAFTTLQTPLPEMLAPGSAAETTQNSAAGAAASREMDFLVLGSSAFGLLAGVLTVFRYTAWRRKRAARWAERMRDAYEAKGPPPERLA
ncbi:MAG: CAP domain-containing protein [Chloroflexi bacterium]|nr:CAP domain-containing protein [Chloroflexota bacterium]